MLVCDWWFKASQELSSLKQKDTEVRQELWHIRKAKIIRVSDAIRLIVFLNTGKLGEFYQNVFCFLKIWFWIGQDDPLHTITGIFTLFLKNFVVSGSCVHEFEMCYRCIFQKMNLLHRLKKWSDDPEIIIFLFYFFFLVENMPSPKI